MAIVIAVGGFFPLTGAAKNTYSFQYVQDIPMPKREQEYLFKMVSERGLDYEETLATIFHESSFQSDAVEKGNYGYFQINKVNHASMAKTLKTENKPLDPYININWGTYMLSDLYQKYAKKGLKGRELKEAVLSAYNKGEGGYKETGKATKYILKHDQSLESIKQWMKKAKE
ncbi:transglycosylase SLT domain-containing protein [Brevibacillus sp. NPDC058079]|uniref:transglycosylase SLT domain-containing protein n=1 Tax=Brevibacillus sp. NPDC058079 TaxID=3346330 RepID=UPI0036EA3590